MKKKFFLFILLLITPLMVFTGYSSWVIIGSKNVDFISKKEAVCYINTDENQYTSIEKALENANNGDKVYVIPNLKNSINESFEIKINKDCSIKEGVSLILPVDDNGTYNNGWGGSESDFADSTLDRRNKNRITLVSIDSNVTLTISSGAFLYIGGTFGSSSNGMSGGINGFYSELLLHKNSKVICNGTIENYGYIKESSYDNGSQLIVDNASILCPFSIYDFKGGTQTLKLNSSNICPFDEYDLSSIQVEMIIYSNSKLNAIARLEPGTQIEKIVTVVGGQNRSDATTENTAIILNSGYVKLKYQSIFENGVCLTKKTDRLTTKAGLYDGELEIGSFKIEISFYSIDTTKMFFPISYRFNYEIGSGATLNIPLKTKFMPGSKLTILPGGKVNVLSDVIFYPSTWAGKTSNTDQLYPSGFDSGKLINNGTLIIHSGASLGGIIETNVDDARITILTDKVGSDNSVSSPDDANSVTAKLQGYIDDLTTLDYFEKKAYESSKSGYWIESNAVFNANYVKITGTPGEANSTRGITTLSATGYFDEQMSIPSTTSISSYSWTLVDSGGAKLSSQTAANPTLTNKTSSEITCYVKVVITDSLGTTAESESTKIIVGAKSGGCFSSDTLVTMGDGSQKEVKDIVKGDKILSFNHFTGKYEPTEIAMLVNHGYDYYDVMNLEFSNGSKIKFMAQHGLFDIVSKEYKVMTIDNYRTFIGRTYLQYDSDTKSNKEVILDNVYITNEYIEAYSILSSRNINAVAENILTMSTSTPGIFNIFELDDNYMVDKELMKQDIEKYGLVTYEEYKDYVPYELFYDFNFEYLNISLAKGLITEEEIARQIEWYYQMIENGEIII